MSLAGHLRTLKPWLLHQIKPETAPGADKWSLRLQDPKTGEIELQGLLSHAPGSTELAILIHGLGGDTGSHYMISAARAAYAAGISCLRVNLRGADGSGADFYHAGLVSDLHAILRSTRLTRYTKIYLVGFSLGGNLVLRGAEGVLDARVVAASAVCPPLDLDRSASFIDSVEGWPYRQYVLRHMIAQYQPVARKHGLSPTAEEAAQIRTIRDWDHRIVAKRWGFTSAEHYYAEASAGPRLSELTIPVLLVIGEGDPMVHVSTIDPSLRAASSDKLTVRRLASAGHVGFAKPIDADLMSWMREHGVAPAP